VTFFCKKRIESGDNMRVYEDRSETGNEAGELLCFKIR